MKIYCSSCGSANSYASKKPNFCQNCGESFGSVKTPGTPSIDQRELYEEDPEEEHEAHIELEAEALDVEIEGSWQTRGVSVADIAGTSEAPKGPAKRKKGGRFTKKAKEEFLKDFEKEAGTTRRGKQK